MNNTTGRFAINLDELYILAANGLRTERVAKEVTSRRWLMVASALVVLSSVCMARLTYSALALFWGEVPSYMVALIIHMVMAVAVGLLFDAAQLSALDQSRGWKTLFGGVVAALLAIVVIGLAIYRSLTFLEGEMPSNSAVMMGLLAGAGEVVADIVVGLFAGLAHATHRLMAEDAEWAKQFQLTIVNHSNKAIGWQREITRIEQQIQRLRADLQTAEASMASRNKALQRLHDRQELLVTRDPGEREGDLELWQPQLHHKPAPRPVPTVAQNGDPRGVRV